MRVKKFKIILLVLSLLVLCVSISTAGEEIKKVSMDVLVVAPGAYILADDELADFLRQYNKAILKIIKRKLVENKLLEEQDECEIIIHTTSWETLEGWKEQR